MERDNIERLASEAGLGGAELTALMVRGSLERFATLVAEECAKVCEAHAAEEEVVIVTRLDDMQREGVSRECAAAIRTQFAAPH